MKYKALKKKRSEAFVALPEVMAAKIEHPKHSPTKMKNIKSRRASKKKSSGSIRSENTSG
jgi:hypothetical protein